MNPLPFDNSELASYGSNYSSPNGEYLVSSYSDLSPTDEINSNHAETLENQIGPQILY